MRVSVIIPVYNAADYVTQAVESALAQPEVAEVILVEDGSPDDSLAVCERIAAQYDRVALYRHPGGANRGAGASRNLGIQRSTCPYIAFLDADDYYLPGRFETARQMFEQDPRIDGVYEAIDAKFENDVARECFFEHGRTSSLTTITQRLEAGELFEALARDTHGHFSVDALVVKRSLFDRTGWFGMHRHEDTAMILKMAAMGYLVPGNLEKPVAIRRVYEGNRLVERLSLIKRYRLKVIMWHSVYQWARQHLDRSRQRVVVQAYLKALTYPYRDMPYGVHHARALWQLVTWSLRHPDLLRSPVYRHELGLRLLGYSGLYRVPVALRWLRRRISGEARV